jgi:hypothetical protein
MPLQTDNLAMVGLGVLGDAPLHSIQPELDDGIHLRWAFAPERGFPWKGGYLLFRRAHREGRNVCIASQFDPKWTAGSLASPTLTLPAGVLESDSALAVTESFAGPDARELDLRGRAYLRFVLPAGQPARSFQVRVGFFGREGGGRGGAEETEPDLSVRGGCLGALLGPLMPDNPSVPAPPPPPIKVTAFDDGVPVASASLSAPAAGIAPASLEAGGGAIATASLAADRIDRVEIEGGPAALIDLCFVPVAQDLAEGWGFIANFDYPMCLPSAGPGYPCPGRPATDALAESLALGRIRYGSPGPWTVVPAGETVSPVAELRAAVDELVVPDPAWWPMADRSGSHPDSLGDPNAPVMPDQRPLDLVLLGALNPAVAQMVGLYWIDDPEPAASLAPAPSATAARGPVAAPMVVPPPPIILPTPPPPTPPPPTPPPPTPPPPSGAYDYLLLADYEGRFHGDPQQALAALSAPLPADVDGWICFNLKKANAPPLPAPQEVEVFALPGSATDPALIAQDRVNAAGLRWRIEQTADGDLLPGAAIGYHVWRASLGNGTAVVPPADGDFTHITQTGMVVVAPPGPSGGQPGASDWPPEPMHKLDSGLVEGWYAYRIRGMDIFGRIGLASGPSVWRQWAPAPEPLPWYYQGPPSNAQIHPFAVRLLDKAPPPAVAGLEAWTLDPLDPALAGEAAYDAWHSIGWWTGLPAADRGKRAGLRLRWRLDPEQMAQAPDIKEFRIYLSPGPEPVPGHADRRAWPERVYVVDAATHYTPALDANGAPTGGRQYQVLLPEDLAGQTFAGVSLEPTDLVPIVYAHVGIGAADHRQHSADDSQWAGGGWGNRDGNQGPVAAAKIARVLRAVPPAPPPIGADDKVWATRADYHGVSRYTFHWAKPPAAGQKVHIFRTVDDALFRADWERRQGGGAAFALADVQPFGWPSSDEPGVLGELGGPDAVKTLDWDTNPAVRAAYEQLGEPALRVLASFAGNDDAFVQTTFEPLDPADAANADRAGPDAKAPYTPDAAWGAYLAEIDGKAANRYFFRAAYVNAAHTPGPLGPSSPAVYCPKVAPPRVPAITKVTSGELAITLEWAHNREPDFAEYRLYRADDERQARDARLMARVATIAKVGVNMNLPAVAWTDTGGLIGGRTYLYCLTSVDDQGNESVPSAIAAAVAVDSRVPEPPVWVEMIWQVAADSGGVPADWPVDGIVPTGSSPVLRLVWASDAPDPSFQITRRVPDGTLWEEVLGTIAPTEIPDCYQLIVGDSDPGSEARYRVRVRSLAGNWSLDNGGVAPPRPGPA